jgi:endonuclease/exonuclease/phosphatase family metal-dependent hydrolase
MAFGPNVVRNGRRYGNAILSRLPILKSKNYDLSVGKKEPRGALRCDLDLGGGQLHVFCLHLGLSISERRQQSLRRSGVNIRPLRLLSSEFFRQEPQLLVVGAMCVMNREQRCRINLED